MRQTIAEAVENLVRDSGDSSVQVVRDHFDGNYEMPLQAV
jgi:hypothetical protein